MGFLNLAGWKTPQDFGDGIGTNVSRALNAGEMNGNLKILLNALNQATAVNTPLTLVSRDVNGDFSARNLSVSNLGAGTTPSLIKLADSSITLNNFVDMQTGFVGQKATVKALLSTNEIKVTNNVFVDWFAPTSPYSVFLVVQSDNPSGSVPQAADFAAIYYVVCNGAGAPLTFIYKLFGTNTLLQVKADGRTLQVKSSQASPNGWAFFRALKIHDASLYNVTAPNGGLNFQPF